MLVSKTMGGEPFIIMVNQSRAASTCADNLIPQLLMQLRRNWSTYQSHLFSLKLRSHGSRLFTQVLKTVVYMPVSCELCHCQLQSVCYLLLQEEEVGPTLTESDLASVQEAVWEGRAKWYNIGLQLGLSPGTLDAIKLGNQSNPDDCFTETLKLWLRGSWNRPSWSGLARSLRAPTVGLVELAEQLPNFDLSN